MKLDKNCRYMETHEWVRVEGDLATAGISDHAQSQLSDVVYVELPEVGDVFDKGEVFATVESVKAAADVYMPIGGEITEVNEELSGAPELVNQDAFGEGWFAGGRMDVKLVNVLWAGERVRARGKLREELVEGSQMRRVLAVWVEKADAAHAPVVVGTASALATSPGYPGKR